MEGLSGAQFIRDKDFHSALLALEQPQEELSWLNAADPAQIWGKVIPHLEGRSFTNVPGTAVAIKAGVPQAVFERQGKTLRTFGEWDEAAGTQMLQSFAAAFRGKTLFAGIKRVVVNIPPNRLKRWQRQALSGKCRIMSCIGNAGGMRRRI